jgi:transcriptional regulator with XRE-family HTH domain
MKLASQIRRRRIELGFTQRRLADLCGVSVNFMSLVENGHRWLSQDMQERVAKELRSEWRLIPKGKDN